MEYFASISGPVPVIRETLELYMFYGSPLLEPVLSSLSQNFFYPGATSGKFPFFALACCESQSRTIIHHRSLRWTELIENQT